MSAGGGPDVPDGAETGERSRAAAEANHQDVSAGGGPDAAEPPEVGQAAGTIPLLPVAPADPPHARWDSVDEFDRAVAEWCEGIHNPALDRLFYSLSTAADHSALWIALGAVESLRRGTPGLAVRLGAAMGIESALTNGLIKSAFRRVRPPSHPFHPPEGPLPYGMRRPITSSFPSGHATAAFTAATLLSTSSRNRTAWFALAGLVAGSRVYVRMHHASDVIAGAALGLVLGQVLRRALRFD